MSRRVRVLGAFASALVVALPVLAASGGDHGGGEHASPTFLGLPHWIWLSVNLILFLGILVRLIGPPLLRFLEARGEEIRQSLRLAAEQQVQARALRDGLGAKLAALEREVEELRSRAERDGEREQQEILAQAEREKDRMVTQAREEIAFRVAQARQELVAHTAALAARLAEERLTSELTPADRNRLFARSLEQLGKEASS